MVCLHISIEHTGGDGYRMTCDNLRREDATAKEVAMANWDCDNEGVSAKRWLAEHGIKE